MPASSSHRFLVRRQSAVLTVTVAAVTALAVPAARAQFGPPAPGTQIHDPAALKPPPGARVAIVEFEDMECPDCARANPLLKEAAASYKIPWVRHDFPLPFHPWSMQAAINARWFDQKGGKKLGDEYRDAVFSNQTSFGEEPARLREFTERFAADHKIELPFAMDPQGKLAAEVKADYALGQRIGIEHTPTIWIVTANSKGAPFIEVVDRNKLYQLIDQALEDTKSTAAARTTAHK